MTRPRAVLQVIAEMGSGGAEAVVAELAAGLPAHDWRVSVASAGGRRLADLARAGAGHTTTPLAGRSPGGVLRLQAALHRVRQEVQPDVLHAHNVGATVAAHLGVRRLRRRPPMVCTFHGVAAQDYRRAAVLLDRCADHVVVVADEVGKRLRAAGLRRTPVTTVVNAVSPPPRTDPVAARAALGLSPDRLVVLCAARLVPQKRHDLLLQAWSRVPGDAVLLLAGAGELPPEVATAAHRLGDRVRVLGERSDMPLVLSAADVFTLASDWEGLPMALLEAMALGLPLVVTAVDGVPGAVGDEAAQLVPAGDPDGLAAALGRVLEDAPLRARMGEAARLRATTRFSTVAMAEAYARLYEEALAGSGRPDAPLRGKSGRGMHGGPSLRA